MNSKDRVLRLLAIIAMLLLATCSVPRRQPYNYYDSGLESEPETSYSDVNQYPDIQERPEVSSDRFEETPCGDPLEGWARILRGQEFNAPYAVVYSPNESLVYVTGSFNEELDIDPGPDLDMHRSLGSTDVYVLALDTNDGCLVWNAVFGGEGPDSVFDITVTQEGSVVVLGEFQGTIDFDPGPGVELRHSNGWDDIFVLNLGSDGEFRWVQTYGADGFERPLGLVADSNSNVIIAATGWSGLDPDENESERNLWTPHLIAFGPRGGHLWTQRISGYIGSLSRYMTGAIDITPNDTILLNTSFRGRGFEVDFDPGPDVDHHLSMGDADVCLLAFDSSGDYLWGLSFEGFGVERPGGVASASDGTIYLSGSIDWRIDLDPGPETDERYSVGDGVFIVKLNPHGEYLWGTTFEGNVREFLLVASDTPERSVIATGRFRETIDVDPGPGETVLESAGFDDILLLYFDEEGELIRGLSYAGPSHNDISRGLDVDGAGSIVLAGTFSGEIDFDPGPDLDLHSAGFGDTFITRLMPGGVYIR